MKKKDAFTGQKMLVLHKKPLKILRKNQFTRGLYVTDVGYFPKAQYHYRERPEGCPEYILIFCAKGKGWIEIEGKRHNLSENQFSIIPKNAPHKYGADYTDPWTIYWIHFNGENTDHFINPFVYPRTLIKTPNSRLRERAYLFEEIYYTLEAGNSLNNLEYSSVLLINLLGSFKYHSLFTQTKTSLNNDPVSIAIALMKENIQKKLSIHEIASSSGLSVSHFCLLFKKKTSHTPIEHFTFLKMQRACHLLDFSTLRINEIAIDIGYDDPYYFTRVFKRVMGKSPSAYRDNIA
ncbi:hypothetical protein B4Q04_14730 [Zobellia sp. OII3]|nr:hypothetical protein B4Q04_14730 [Zobellia sp. OII3]